VAALVKARIPPIHLGGDNSKPEAGRLAAGFFLLAVAGGG
jgi:hypothetical protein